MCRTDRRRPDGPHQHGGREVFVPRARAGVRAGVDGSRGSAQAGRQAELGGRRYVELRRAVVGAGHQRDTIRGSFTNGVRHENSAWRSPYKHTSGSVASHLETHQDLHERGSRETTIFRNDPTDFREDETLILLNDTINPF